MPLTQNFKSLLKGVAIVAVVAVVGWQADKNKYWGMLDSKPEAQIVETNTPAEPEYGISVGPGPGPVVQRVEIPVEDQYQAPAAPAEPTPDAAPGNHAIDKLKGLDKL